MKPANKGLWFPISLGLLVLLALPVVLLLLLSLMGHEQEANVWLQGALGLSYHNPLPLWASLLLLLVPAALLLLYFLKLRRKALLVPSTFLWRKSIDDLHVNSLFQWLRDNVLLLVQLCVVLLLIYSALAFQVHGKERQMGKRYILIIDSSASMGCTDVSPSRLEAAKEEALQEIDARAEGDLGMVIEFNSRASILQSYTDDRALLRAAVRGIRQTSRVSRLEQALSLAAARANPLKSTDDEAVRPEGEDPAARRQYVSLDGLAAEVHLYSDGRFPDVPEGEFSAGNLALQYHRVGAAGPENVNNVGIVTLSATRDENDPSRVLAFVRVRNYSPKQDDVSVELKWGPVGRDEFNIKEEALSLPGRKLEKDEAGKGQGGDTPGEAGAEFALEEVDEDAEVLLHARLMKRDGGKLVPHADHFALDDQAWLVIGVVRKARVLVVTTGNKPLADVLTGEETQKIAEVTFVKPDGREASFLEPGNATEEARHGRAARGGEFDLVVFDRCRPPRQELMPLGNTFFIDDLPPPWGNKKRKELGKDAFIRNSSSTHPLMRYLTGLDEIAFVGGLDFDLSREDDKTVPPLVPKLLEAGGNRALLFVLSEPYEADGRPPKKRLRGGFQDLVLAFPLVNDEGKWTSDWPSKLSFPLFLRNVLYQLGNVGDSIDEVVQPGALKVLRPGGKFDGIEVRGPGGKAVRVKRGTAGEFPFADTEEVGVYQGTWPGGRRTFAVNLLDEEESDTRPRDAIKLGDQEVQAGEGRPRVYDTWKWVVLVVLVLLVLEWGMYHRRVWV